MKRGIIYKGPSMYDGQPIVVIATLTGDNSKTGKMVQTYILKENEDPRDANKSGSDFSICGNCPHRGQPTTDPKRKLAKGRTCYVRIDTGVLNVWRAYKRGAYADAQSPYETASIGKGRMVRLGTYGDPAAVPAQVWQDLLKLSKGWTGYTHSPGAMWKIVMQSADTLAQAQDFWAQGMRTFRIVQDVAEIDPEREVNCPASKEMGRRSTCEKCQLCNGIMSNSPKSVAIVMH